MPWGDNRWEHGAYLEPMDAVYDQATGVLSVVFRDGGRATVPVAALHATGLGARWDKLRVKKGVCIRVPVDKGKGDLGASYTDIPGDAIRILTDDDFAAHMAREAEAHARHVGATLRRLREARGLSTTTLGRRAGMRQQGVSRIENGRHDVSLSTLEKLLAAMGCTLRDVSEADSAPASTPQAG